jgi:Sec7 domain
MEAFAQEYYRQGKGQHPFVDADAAFILAFSIIMLNTDLHNPQVHCYHYTIYYFVLMCISIGRYHALLYMLVRYK